MSEEEISSPPLVECRRCKEPQLPEKFPIEKRNLSGRAGTCKKCVASKQASSQRYKNYQKAYYARNRDRLKKYQRQYGQDNAESIAEKNRLYRKNNKSRIAMSDTKYYLENKEHLTTYKANYYQENRERLKAKAKKYYNENKEEVFRYYRERAKQDPVFRQKKALRNMLRKFLLRTNQDKTTKSHTLLGYTTKDMMTRLEYQFKDGMTWENYGEWHIDHKIPVAYFLSKGEKRPHIVNALSNLQPLWAEENIRKGDSLPAELVREI